MNNNELNKLLKTCSTIEWDLKKANKDSLVFYSSSDLSDNAISKFKERIKGSNYLKIITNLKVNKENVISVEQDKLLNLMKEACDYFYPLPKIQSIAITGTNGKTTTVDIIRQLLTNKGIKVLTVGTMGVYLGNDKVDDFNLTSPHYIDLRMVINKYLADNDVLAIESSSHAIDQKRQYGLVFNAIGFTSFSQDHLDYHQTLEKYLKAKLKLQDQCDSPLILSDKAIKLKKLVQSYKVFDNKENIENDYLNISYNLINLDVALGCLDQIGFKFSLTEINNIKETAGRFNIIKNKDQIFIIDFAHTPDSLENILIAAKENLKKEVVCVFGCGGNRDRSKRELMGAVADKNSSFVVVTSDNPRLEDPGLIIKDIEKGIKGNNFISIVDRYDAIKYAFEKFRDHVILIAGKGHEEYIDQNGSKRFFSDTQTIKGFISDKP